MQVIYAPKGIDEEIETELKELTGGYTLFKNTYRDINGHLVRGDFSDAVRVAEYIDKLNRDAGQDKYGFCLDVGVCNICGQNLYEFIIILGKRIKVVILRENDGQKDSSMLPFSYAPIWKSQTDWKSLILGLRKIDFDGVLLLDYKHSTSAFSHLLRPKINDLAQAVGEYFKWQIDQEKVLKKYDTRVLFGAGNMCRNYMKYYGNKYRPLFTCDNNATIWGKTFEGLEIKEPQVLRKLSPDCAIFICNIYYDEIERQLKDIGVTNPIERFNDEYMPFDGNKYD